MVGVIPEAQFSYEDAFTRNIGWVTECEQGTLREKKIAIAGMGGVGGLHLLTLARLGIGAFHIADLDRFELANFNRQVGATIQTLGRPKVQVLAEMAAGINPELNISTWAQGIDAANLDAFLDGVDLFVDGIDFFALDIRRRIFARCAERRIPAITAAPLGMGTGYLVFMPGGMTFEEYFRLEGLPQEQQYVNFFLGLVPKALQRTYLVDPSRMDLAGHRGPSSIAGCQLCASVAGVEAIKILLKRGPVRAAPCYHQFDAYRGKWVAGRLRGGNANPLQRLKLRQAYRHFAALSGESHESSIHVGSTEIEKILDLGRWAPSGDNTQPWRFEIRGDDAVTIHLRDQADHDIYDYRDGEPCLMSGGALLETLRVAASKYGRMLWWDYAGSTGHDHRIDVDLSRAPGVTLDPLEPYVTVRSVDRNPYRTTPLTPSQKTALSAALGDQFAVHWYEDTRKRWRLARLSGLATDIRLRIPEAFAVHQAIIEWERQFSPDKIPATAIGIDAMTLRIMRWAMRDWKRMDRLNRLPSGTLAARLQMDYLPGLASAAYFTVTRTQPAAGAASAEARIPSLLRAGQGLQRFWLTATRMGLVMQPAMAIAIFAHHARQQEPFTADAKIRRKADTLARKLNRLIEVEPERLLFMGRVGTPRSRHMQSRSVRRSLDELCIGRENEREAAAGNKKVGGSSIPPTVTAKGA